MRSCCRSNFRVSTPYVGRVLIFRRTYIAICAVMAMTSLAAAAVDLRLIQAVRERNLEPGRTLLKQRVDVNTPQGDGSTALHWAARGHDLTSASAGVAAGARPHAAGRQVLD